MGPFALVKDVLHALRLHEIRKCLVVGHEAILPAAPDPEQMELPGASHATSLARSAGRLPNEQAHLGMRRLEIGTDAELLERFRRRRADRSNTALAQRR